VFHAKIEQTVSVQVANPASAADALRQSEPACDVTRHQIISTGSKQKTYAHTLIELVFGKFSLK
jgi:hypothetical protein